MLLSSRFFLSRECVLAQNACAEATIAKTAWQNCGKFLLAHQTTMPVILAFFFCFVLASFFALQRRYPGTNTSSRFGDM